MEEGCACWGAAASQSPDLELLAHGGCCPGAQGGDGTSLVGVGGPGVGTYMRGMLTTFNHSCGTWVTSSQPWEDNL